MTPTNKYPKPETLQAMLATAYFKAPVFTPHIYVRTKKTVLAHGDGEAYEFIYKCLVHGTERRWGTMDIAAATELVN